MGYVIAAQRPHREMGSVVELNPVLLAAMIGEKAEDVEKGIKFLCSPDKSSRSKEEEGRRLVEVGPFLYRVVNGAKYRAIRDEETRLEQLRTAQRTHREKKRKGELKPTKLRIESAGYVEKVKQHGEEPKDKNAPWDGD
jgi:hypothetical protein